MTPVVKKSGPANTGLALAPLLWLGVAMLAFCCAAALLARFHPLLELFVHFPAQYLVAGIVLAVFALLARRYWAFVLALGLGLSNLAPLWPYAFEAPPRIEAAGPTLRLVTANLNNMETDVSSLQRFLESTNADIVLLTELAGQLDPAFARLDDRFKGRLRTTGTRHHPHGMVILARRPLQQVVVHQTFGVDYPIVEFRHCDDAARSCITIVALHAVRPGDEFGDLRDQMLGFAVERVRLAAQIGDQAIIAGDLNTTPWSPAFDRFTVLGLRDAGLGQGWLPTWPVAMGVGGIPIDHVLVSPAIAVRRYQRLDPMGSDHWPVAVELVLPAKSR